MAKKMEVHQQLKKPTHKEYIESVDACIKSAANTMDLFDKVNDMGKRRGYTTLRIGQDFKKRARALGKSDRSIQRFLPSEYKRLPRGATTHERVSAKMSLTQAQGHKSKSTAGPHPQMERVTNQEKQNISNLAMEMLRATNKEEEEEPPTPKRSRFDEMEEEEEREKEREKELKAVPGYTSDQIDKVTDIEIAKEGWKYQLKRADSLEGLNKQTPAVQKGKKGQRCEYSKCSNKSVGKSASASYCKEHLPIMKEKHRLAREATGTFLNKYLNKQTKKAEDKQPNEGQSGNLTTCIKCFKPGVHILQKEKEDKDGYFPSYYWHPDTKTTCDLGMTIDFSRHLQNVQDRIDKEDGVC